MIRIMCVSVCIKQVGFSNTQNSAPQRCNSEKTTETWSALTKTAHQNESECSSCCAARLGPLRSKVCCQVVECPLVSLSALPALGSTGTTERITDDPPTGYLPSPAPTQPIYTRPALMASCISTFQIFRRLLMLCSTAINLSNNGTICTPPPLHPKKLELCFSTRWLRWISHVDWKTTV